MTGNGQVATSKRERSHRWADPSASASAARERGGLDFLQAIASGELPPAPVSETLGFTLREVESGRAVFEIVPAEFHYNPIGTVHGGVYATLLDSAAGCALHSLLPDGVGYTSLDLTVKFLRPITTDARHALSTHVRDIRSVSEHARAATCDSRE